MLRKYMEAFLAWDKRTSESFYNPTTNKDFIVAFLMVAAFWAFAWYAHIIGPWVDNLMGWGPHDIDSARKVQWRRMWSSAICIPGLIVLALLYIRNWRERRNFKQ